VTTVGFVGTVEIETRDVARLWFGLTTSKDSSDWIKIGAVRAWFTTNLEAADRPSFMAQLPLLMEAMRSGLQVEVSHGGAADFNHKDANDSFEVDGIRVLRAPMRF
jgi:hypothetical protein